MPAHQSTYLAQLVFLADSFGPDANLYPFPNILRGGTRVLLLVVKVAQNIIVEIPRGGLVLVVGFDSCSPSKIDVFQLGNTYIIHNIGGREASGLLLFVKCSLV